LWTKANAILLGFDLKNVLAATGEFRQVPSHTTATEPSPGGSLPWEGGAKGPIGSSSINTANGNKLTSLRLFSYKVRGGQTIDFSLYHNSETTYNDELGHGWTWSYDLYINEDDTVATVHWGDGLAIPFTLSGSNYVAPAGIFDTLVKNGDGTWKVTRKDQSVYNFNAAGFITSIKDRNNNVISFTLNSANYVTKITDPSGRHTDITLDGSNNFTSVTDPSGRTWSFTRNGSDDLTTVTWPVLNTVTYTDGFTYNTGHDILTHTDKRGKVWTNTYFSDGSIKTEVNPLGKTWTYAYTASATTITDPLAKVVTHNYSSGKLASIQDEAGFSASQTLSSANLPLTITDRRGKVWTYTYDSKGNVLTVKNPLNKTWTYTYNSKNDILTSTDPLTHVTTYTYDTAGNLATITDPLSRVQTYSANS